MKVLKIVIALIVIVILTNLIFPETTDRLLQRLSSATGVEEGSMKEQLDKASDAVSDTIHDVDKKVDDYIEGVD